MQDFLPATRDFNGALGQVTAKLYDAIGPAVGDHHGVTRDEYSANQIRGGS